MERKPIQSSDRSDPSDRTDQADREGLRRPRRLRPSGGYRELRSFQTTTLIYDGTVGFCDRFVNKRSRTHDQMVQGARSGRQNIAEGSRAGATSGKSELHLTNVARSSLDELLLDYEDFLRQRRLRRWDKDDPEAKEVRQRAKYPSDRPDLTDPTDLGDRARWEWYAPWLEHEDPGVVANALICLIHQANYLLDQQIASLERSIIEDGGYREQLTAARLAHRELDRSDPSDQSDQMERAPTCPRCGKAMARRTVRRGRNAGSQFWGCTGYPDCKGTRPVERTDPSDRTDPTDRSNPSDPSDPTDRRK